MKRWWIILPVLALSATGCRSAAPPSAMLPAAPPPPPPNPPAPPMPPLESPLMICEGENGWMAPRDSTAVSGDTVAARPVTAQTVAGAAWYRNNEPIPFRGRRYVKYGLPRVLGIDDLVRVGSYQGVPVFAAPGDRNHPVVIYVATSARCEFHPYQSIRDAGPSRGGQRDRGR